MSTQGSNQFKKELLSGTINGSTDVFKMILMQTAFIYNKDTYGEYADVSANELATGSGYTVGGLTLTGVAISQDDVNDMGVIAWNNAAWTASGGSIIASGAIIYDDTHASDVIVGYIDFSGDQTTLDGGVFTIVDVEVRIL